MPDRILRVGILTSESVNRLSWPAEVFYRRLMSVVDDFGRYDGRPAVLRASLYALKVDRVSEPDIGKWIRESEEAGLVRRYTVTEKPYLELLKFEQKVRAVKSKWPDPPAIADTCQQTSANASVVEVVVGIGDEGKTLSGCPPDAVPQKFDRINGYRATAKEILAFLNEKTGKKFEDVDVHLELIVARLREGTSPDDLRSVIAMKCREWLGDPKTSTWLRPKTLFGKTNFAQYKGELKA
jgi:uncharacterized phage protein (TIGR02220 family)